MLESILLTSSQKIIVSLNKPLRKSFLFNSIKSIAEKSSARKSSAGKSFTGKPSARKSSAGKSSTRKPSAKKSFIFKTIKSTISYNIRENSLANIFDDNKNKKKLVK